MAFEPCGCTDTYPCTTHTPSDDATGSPHGSWTRPGLTAVIPTTNWHQGPPIKDSGQRKEFASGMVRDTTESKIDYTLIFDGPMLERWALHMTKGAAKYSKANWMLAAGQEELDRFKESALRHFIQWFRGDTDEDHASAVFFNINGACYVQDKLKGLHE